MNLGEENDMLRTVSDHSSLFMTAKLLIIVCYELLTVCNMSYIVLHPS